jgi:phospholipase/carboxylesterase
MPPVLLLHGLYGDENAMWVLEHALPPMGLTAAPRGLYEVAEGGYSWVDEPLSGWPTAGSFRPAVDALALLLGDLREAHDLGERRPVLLGFSQGAALAFAGAAALNAAAVVAAAGFLPEGGLDRLAGLPVFWGHGTGDEMVPVERAREGATRLRALGAEVTLCEAEVGHKLGIECLRGLKTWMRGQFH